MKLIAVLSLLALSACAGTNPPLCQVQTPGSNVTVHSYGDSITAGAGADNFCLGYQSLFTQAVKGNADDEGISGSPLSLEMAGIMSLQAQPQDIITILPGFNDASLYGSDSAKLSQFLSELREALTYLANQGRIVLVGTTLYASQEMISKAIPLHTNANVDLYVNVIKAVVLNLQSQGMTKLVLVDTNAIYNPETMSENNYHPDDYGHQVLARQFFQSFSDSGL